MICMYCKTDTVEWVGKWTNLIGTKCTACGFENCQEVPMDEDEQEEVEANAL